MCDIFALVNLFILRQLSRYIIFEVRGSVNYIGRNVSRPCELSVLEQSKKYMNKEWSYSVLLVSVQLIP